MEALSCSEALRPWGEVFRPQRTTPQICLAAPRRRNYKTLTLANSSPDVILLSINDLYEHMTDVPLAWAESGVRLR